MLFLTPERFLALAGTETAVLWHAFFNVSKHVLLIHFLKSKLCSAKVNKLPTSAGCKRDPDAAENQNSHLQKSAGQNQNLLRHCPSHKILLDPPRAGPGCSLVLTVWHIWEKFIWSYCSSMSSIAAAQTIHTDRFLWLWVSHTQGKCWKQAQTSDSQHITPSSCSTSVSAHPPLKRNCWSPKPVFSLLGDPFEKQKVGKKPGFQPALTPSILQVLCQGSAHCSWARIPEVVCKHMASSLWPFTQTKSCH